MGEKRIKNLLGQAWEHKCNSAYSDMATAANKYLDVIAILNDSERTRWQVDKERGQELLNEAVLDIRLALARIDALPTLREVVNEVCNDKSFEPMSTKQDKGNLDA
jgi:hypothetical protein